MAKDEEKPSSSSLVAVEEFWARTAETPDGCRLWKGPVDKKGSPRCAADPDLGRERFARRAAWRIANGSIPDGYLVVDTCGNRRCMKHLALRTRFEAARERALTGRVGRAAARAKLPAAELVLKEALAASAAARVSRRSRRRIDLVVT